jgi:GNAT superfamily N-acetyltransferase
MSLLHGRDAIRAAAGDSPYVRTHTTGREIVGYHRDGLTAWVGTGPWGEVGCVLGSPGQAREAIQLLHKETGREWWQIPPGSEAEIGLPAIARRVAWNFRWTDGELVPRPGFQRVRRLAESDVDGISAVLAAALPDAGGKPGDPRIRAWYGVGDGDRLVAVAADKSLGGVGFLSSIAVLPTHQGQGLGSILTTTVGAALCREHGQVALAVEEPNRDADRLYLRLGFRGGLARCSVQLAVS